MPRTTNKGIRFTAEEMRRIAMLRAQLPEYSSDADLLHHAALLGMLVLATAATRPGLPPYAGYGADDLAALLKPRLLPAIDFLLARGMLPLLVGGPSVSASAPLAAAMRPDIPAAAPIDDAVADDLAGLGSGFMDG